MRQLARLRFLGARLAATLVLLLGGFICVWVSFWAGLVLMLIGILLLICLWPQAADRPAEAVSEVAPEAAAASQEDADEATPTAARQQQRLSFLSHDLRSPVASVLALAESMRVEETDADKLNKLSMLVGYAERSLRTSEQLVQLLRVESLTSIAGTPLELLALAEEVRDEQLLRARAADVSLDVQLDGTVEPWVEGQGELLQLALDNLVDNAIKYSFPKGQVMLQLGVDPKGMAYCRVADQGCGIDAEDVGQLFEHYGRLRHSPPALNGAGLGLHLVAAIAKQHGGSVDVESDSGKGCAVTLRLPQITIED